MTTRTCCCLRCLWVALLVLGTAIAPRPAYPQAPAEWIYAGVLLDGGSPYSGAVNIDVDVFDSQDASSPIWSESHEAVEVTGGAFVVRLGAGDHPFSIDLLTGEPLWIELTVEGESLEPRLPVASVPYAQRATVAERSENAGGLFVGSTQVIDSSGHWTGSPIDEDHLDLPVEMNYVQAALVAQADQIMDLQRRVQTLETAMEDQTETLDALVLDMVELQDRLQHLRREGVNLILEGANLHIRSGGNSTYHSADLNSWGTPNGRGNLVVGYDESGYRNSDGFGGDLTGATGGSHNVVIGPGNAYPGFASLVVGRNNRLGPSEGTEYLSVPGCFATGSDNKVQGAFSAIVGGSQNTTESYASFIAGGTRNTVSGDRAAIVAGSDNEAEGDYSCVLSGSYNSTVYNLTTAIGGQNNSASDVGATVVGGSFNTASQNYSTSVGGSQNTASGLQSCVLCGSNNQVDGQAAVVVGGHDNEADGMNACTLGGSANDADGSDSVIAGGIGNRTRTSPSGDTVVGATDQNVTGAGHYCAPAPSCATDPD